MKEYITKIAHYIRRVLTFFKNEMMPRKLKKFETFTLRSETIKSAYEIYIEEEIKSSYNHFKKYFNKTIFLKKWTLREYGMQKALDNHQENYFYLEFGVFKGASLNFFSRFLKPKNILIYGFDSFKGITEDWLGTQIRKGSMDLKGTIPKTNSNCRIIDGLVEKTLPKFIDENKNLKINFVHMDLDTFSPTNFALKIIKPFLVNNSIIIFDNFYNQAGWQYNEYKALTENFNENEYRFISFGLDRESAAIQIMK